MIKPLPVVIVVCTWHENLQSDAARGFACRRVRFHCRSWEPDPDSSTAGVPAANVNNSLPSPLNPSCHSISSVVRNPRLVVLSAFHQCLRCSVCDEERWIGNCSINLFLSFKRLLVLEIHLRFSPLPKSSLALFGGALTRVSPRCITASPGVPWTCRRPTWYIVNGEQSSVVEVHNVSLGSHTSAAGWPGFLLRTSCRKRLCSVPHGSSRCHENDVSIRSRHWCLPFGAPHWHAMPRAISLIVTATVSLALPVCNVCSFVLSLLLVLCGYTASLVLKCMERSTYPP